MDHVNCGIRALSVPLQDFVKAYGDQSAVAGTAPMQVSTAPHQIAAADTSCAVEGVLGPGTAAEADATAVDASAPPLTEPAKKRKKSECTPDTPGTAS